MAKIIFIFIFIAWLATPDVFAQRGGVREQAQPRATNVTVVELEGITVARLPQRNDEAGIAARNAIEAIQRIINPEMSEFSFMQPSKEEQRAWFQQAIDTLQTLLVFVNPPEVEEAVSPEVLLYGEQAERPAPFVPDALVNAHYLLGMGWIYSSMMNRTGLFGPEETEDLSRAIATYFENFVQNGIGEGFAFIHSFLASFYTWVESDPRRALINVDRAIALEPREPSHHIMRAQILQAQGYIEQACASLRRASELDETPIAVGMMQTWGCP